MYRKAQFWLILGAALIISGLIIAHICNAGINLLFCSYEGPSDFVFHKMGSLFLAIGIVMWFLHKFKNP
jgi:hypothetical protein